MFHQMEMSQKTCLMSNLKYCIQNKAQNKGNISKEARFKVTTMTVDQQLNICTLNCAQNHYETTSRDSALMTSNIPH